MRNNRIRQGAQWLLMVGLLANAVNGSTAQAESQDAGVAELGPASSTEELLAQLVKRAKVIFAGEVYAFQTAKDQQGIVEVMVRVDQGVRGAQTGSGFVLRLNQSLAQNFRQGERYFLFVGSVDPSGLNQTVGGPVGILPVDQNHEVDLSRLHALVRPAGGEGSKAGAANTNPAGKTNQDAARSQGQVGGVADAGDGNIPVITQQNQMPELEQPKVAFLAMLRDVFVLSAAAEPAKTRERQRNSEGDSDAQLGN
jgi:hypothetical protein